MRCPTMSKALQVFSPSLRTVQVSGRSRSNELRAAGVRANSDMVSCKLCCIVALKPSSYFLREISSANNHGNGFAVIALRVLVECRHRDAGRAFHHQAFL